MRARPLTLLGDACRDQGMLTGPRCALARTRLAKQMFADLDVPRRVHLVDDGQRELDLRDRRQSDRYRLISHIPD